MKKLLPIFISVLIITVNVLVADASENLLRGVDVKKGANSYTVELTSTAPAKITKTIVSNNRILINLKNIGVSSNLSTKFGGNAVIDNVMVEPCGADSVNVMVQADDVAYSDIVFKEPTAFQNAEDTVKGSFSSLFSVLSGTSTKDRGIQFGILAIFLMILVGEVRFIKSKYDELNQEKAELLRNIEATKDFDEYLPNYGNTGLKKPYTTPLYGTNSTVGVNTNAIRRNGIKRLVTPETTTLNSLLYNRNQENKIIDRIINHKPVFGALSNINVNELKEKFETQRTVSNPLEKTKLKANVQHLEALTALYKERVHTDEPVKELHSRLNRIY